jgi:integrative and conjugative element protein (TIGR02256 family)
MKLLPTRRAYNSMLRECISYPNTESGGILVGRKISADVFVVPFAIGSGPKASRSRTRFTPDVDWQQPILDRLFEAFGINYVGSFHRHPGSYSQPSFLDLRSAKDITSSQEWNVREAVFPILVFNGEVIEIYPYYFSRDSGGFRAISWQVIPNNDQLARAALGRRGK